jgi:hypothetical protein
MSSPIAFDADPALFPSTMTPPRESRLAREFIKFPKKEADIAINLAGRCIRDGFSNYYLFGDAFL